MTTRKLRKIPRMLLGMLLIAISLYGCGNSTNKLPCEKGPGYWASKNGAMWFYTEGNNVNYYRATGEIIIGKNRVPINITWNKYHHIVVRNDAGTELFTGYTRMNKTELAEGRCLMIIEQWSVDELFPDDELVFKWCGEDKPTG